MSIANEIKKVKESASWIKKKIKGRKPETAIITGSGLSDSLPDLKDKIVIPYKNIPCFGATTVKGHKGELIFGKYRNKDIVIMRGRFHYYEGRDMNQIAIPVRILHLLGVGNLIVTAAVGSLKSSIKPGDLVILKDHMNFMGSSSLIGNYSSKFGEMFPDMSEPYDIKLMNKVLAKAKKLSIKAFKGVYFAVSGPSYETPSEVKAYRMLGGDVAGMSVVPEVAAARQVKMRILGICWISNFASGITSKVLEHSEVLQLGEKVSRKIKKLIESVLEDIA